MLTLPVNKTNVAMTGVLVESLLETIHIVGIIFILMVVIELVVLKYRSTLLRVTAKNKFLSYAISAFFGIIPGCTGTFAMDSLYMAGFLGVGGIVSVLIATMGDDAFLLFSYVINGQVPLITAITIMVSLFVLGIGGGAVADWLVRTFKIKFRDVCHIEHHAQASFSLRHFMREHVLNHILKKHIWQVLLWVFAALFLIEYFHEALSAYDLHSKSGFYLIIVAATIGLLPVTGTNVLLFVMFVKGLIPVSALMANSIVQDGHGLLPLLGFSVSDALKIKLFNFLYGLLIGGLLFAAGL